MVSPARPTASASELAEAVAAEARALGFDAVGFARADEPLGVEHDRYLEFVAAGRHGEMGYLAEHADARRRLDTDAILPGAKSVVCVAMRYARDDAADPPLAASIARYARGRDYHAFLRRRVQRLAAFIRKLAPGVGARPLCDVEPVLERAWAARAGLGFVGKHGLVITPGLGSYQLLGEVVTTLQLPPGVPIAERCGSCTRCLDACPTSAFAAPFVLDPRRCISYLTIEKAGPAPEDLEPAIGEHLFGCDACQEACPFNRAAPAPPERTEPFAPKPEWSGRGLADLVELGPDAWSVQFEGTPVRRIGRAGLARNAVVVAKNRLEKGPDADAERALEAGRAHDDAVVRDVARRR